jgi:hypothetical protein
MGSRNYTELSNALSVHAKLSYFCCKSAAYETFADTAAAQTMMQHWTSAAQRQHRLKHPHKGCS